MIDRQCVHMVHTKIGVLSFEICVLVLIPRIPSRRNEEQQLLRRSVSKWRNYRLMKAAKTGKDIIEQKDIKLQNIHQIKSGLNSEFALRISPLFQHI